jgi:alkylated DNA nucleotide flippase Atl1
LLVESFFVRRLLIGRATNNLNRILLSAVVEMDADKPVDQALRQYLSTGRKHFASDAELRKAVPVYPFYLNGRANQRSLVLQWIEQSHDNKEPVDLAGLTIEHVMPQTLTDEWTEVLREERDSDESIEELHQGLLHTIGNLTLTGYNSELSNSPFDVKRALLSTSGVTMNQAIAHADVWGPRSIRERSAALVDRIISIWPGSLNADELTESDVPWDVMNAALAALPHGSWTTYGDVAALIGSHPVPVGTRLANYPVPNAHRVLQVEGTVSERFRWPNPARTDDPIDVLRLEGIEFTDQGRADPNQRMTTAELALLLGMEEDSLPTPISDLSPGQDETLRNKFVAQMTENQSPDAVHGVMLALKEWEAMGGRLEYGKGAETSCFLIARPESDSRGSIWPLTVYPTGKCEVVFQHLATRVPFDQSQLREELRERLNTVRGIDLPASKIELRPGFDAAVFGDATARQGVLEQLAWFWKQATSK